VGGSTGHFAARKHSFFRREREFLVFPGAFGSGMHNKQRRVMPGFVSGLSAGLAALRVMIEERTLFSRTTGIFGEATAS
jgi:hypothetical protein